MADDFYVNEYGEVVRKQYQDTAHTETDEEKLMNEYSVLSYEIHHLTRPTTDSEKISRYKELKKILKIDENASGTAFAKAKENVRMMAIAKKQNNTVLQDAIKRQKIQQEGTK